MGSWVFRFLVGPNATPSLRPPPLKKNPPPLLYPFRWSTFLMSYSSSDFGNTRTLLLCTFSYQSDKKIERKNEATLSELKPITEQQLLSNLFFLTMVLYLNSYSSNIAHFLIGFLALIRWSSRFDEHCLTRPGSCTVVVLSASEAGEAHVMRENLVVGYVSLQLPRLIRLRARRGQNV